MATIPTLPHGVSDYVAAFDLFDRRHPRRPPCRDAQSGPSSGGMVVPGEGSKRTSVHRQPHQHFGWKLPEKLNQLFARL